MRDMLQRTIPPLLRARTTAAALLIGRDSEEARKHIVAENPDLRERLKATGALSIRNVSLHLQACDLFVQPYPDGVSGRRTSVIAAMNHGKAVVTTSGHLTEAFWKQSGAVALAPVDDTAAIVARTEELLGDPSARHQLGQRAKTFCDEHFSRARLREVLSL
jgi:glycosyltransferase involved in cell wall biosynthesis